MRSFLVALTCSLLLLTTAPDRATAAESKVDAEGFIIDWLMIGPISVPEDGGAEAIDVKQIAEEAALAPKAGDKQKIAGKELVWKAVKATDMNYYVDLNATLGGKFDDSLAYLVTYVFADAEMKDITANMSSNDQGKVYLNGKEIITFTGVRPIDKEGDKKEGVTLNKGKNVIVFKIINEKSDWAAALRFTSKDGKPITTLTTKIEP